MEKKYARLAALLAAAVLCGNGAPSMADNIWGTVDNGWHTVIDSDYNGNVYGHRNNPDANGIVTGHVEMTGGNVMGHQIYGGFAEDAGDVKDSTVKITSGTVTGGDVYGGRSNKGEVSGNTVRITGGTVDIMGNVYGGWSDENSAAYNTVRITGGTVGDVYGGNTEGGLATYNTVTINGGEMTGEIFGGWGDTDATNNRVTITDGTVKNSVYGGQSNNGKATYNTVTITGGTVDVNVYGGSSNKGEVSHNTVTITDGTVTVYVCGGSTDGGAATRNTVTINGGKVTGIVCGGYGDTGATYNKVTITGGKVGDDVSGGTVNINGSVYGGFSDTGTVTGNTVELLGSANVSAASLYGSNKAATGYDGNKLLINGWSGTVNSVQNFDEVTFRNIQWKTDGTVLDITHNAQKNSLENTTVKVEQLSMAGGTALHAGDKMTLIQSNEDTGIKLDKVDVTEASEFTAGVTAVGTGSAEMDGEKKLVYKISNVERNRQTDTVAENRLAGAAFVNQGADIAADSLRLLDDGYHFGTQTFGAVYGNRSQYDVASDIKINGWSEIAGFGNIHEVKGGRLAWGVFYENGTGNYRTWNTFNNEMFRGDGSLLYNGGGAAIRLTKDSGMYYEASLRAGTLSSSMTNAVKDGNGNSYGFDSDSTYWGAHVGAGKLIQRGSGQWDIYGKYFHTDIDGDSFEMGGDRFSFDSVTSDRLRLGARYTADTDKAWSLYCGAAYEYEFSGDSRMKAGQFDAPEQSLQGSTVFGEIGTVWGRKDSPWSMDVNLRGYAGEREGFSGMVQLAYAF